MNLIPLSFSQFLAGPALEQQAKTFEKRLSEARSDAFREGLSEGHRKREPDDAFPRSRFYSSVYNSITAKDLDLSDQRDMIRRAHAFYATKGLAKRAVDIAIDYALGKGLTYSVDSPEKRNKELANVVSNFWDGEENALNVFQEEMVQDWWLSGEMCIPAAVQPENGDVTLGYVDPLEVTNVLPDPRNRAKLKWVVVGDSHNAVALRIVRLFRVAEYMDQEIPFSEAARNLVVEKSMKFNGLLAGMVNRTMENAIFQQDVKRLLEKGFPLTNLDARVTGESLFFALNKPRGGTRGKSLILHSMDNIQLHEQTNLNVIQRTAVMLAFLYHVIVEGESDNDRIQKIVNDIGLNVIRPGEVKATNEKIKINALAPALAAGDVVAIETMIREGVLGSLGLPAHFFGSGSNSNLATATAQEAPTLRSFEGLQGKVLHAFDRMTQYQIDQKIAHGMLKTEDVQKRKRRFRDDFSIVGPAVSAKDDQKMSATLQTLTTTLMTAVNSNLISEEEAERIFQEALTKSDFQLPDREELEEAKNKAKDKKQPPLSTVYEAYRKAG